MSTQPDKTLGQIVSEKLWDGFPHFLTGNKIEIHKSQLGAVAQIIDSVAQAQSVKSLEEIAREAASEVDDLCDCYCQSSVTEKEPIILRACQAAVRANRE